MVAGVVAEGNAPAGGVDRRRDERHSVMLPGMIHRPDGSEFRCVSENASVSGFEIIVGREFYVGERLKLMLHHLERIEIEVMRTTPRGFGAKILRTSLPREAFLGKLRRLVEVQSGKAGTGTGTVDQRRHPRVVPEHKATTIQLKGRPPRDAELIDVSQSGAAVNSGEAVRIGQRVLMGRRPSTIVRVMPQGFAVRFDEPLHPRATPGVVALI